MRLHSLLLGLGLLVSASLWSSPAAAGRGHWDYVYYPDHHLYYAPHNGYWYWRVDDHWRYGPVLPRHFVSVAIGGISIRLDVDHPYLRHDYVVHHHRPRHVVHHHYRPRVHYYGGHGGWSGYRHGDSHRWRSHDRDDRREWRQDSRDDRREWRQDSRDDRREWRQDDRDDRREWRQDRRDDRRESRPAGRRDDRRRNPNMQ